MRAKGRRPVTNQPAAIDAEVVEQPGWVAAAYLVAAFGWTWAWWFIAIALLRRTPEGSLLQLLSATLGDIGPAVAIWCFVAWRSGTGSAWRMVRTVFRRPRVWWPWILFSAIVIGTVGVAAAAQRSGGGAVAPAPSLWLLLPNLALMVVIGGGQEELGWRGFLQPWMVRRIGRWPAPLIVGVVWFCWHLPLFWTPGSIQTRIPVLAFAGFIIGFSMLLAKAVELSDGHPGIAVWLHALNNLAGLYLVFHSAGPGATVIGSYVLAVAYLFSGCVAMCLPTGAPSRITGAARVSDRSTARAETHRGTAARDVL